MLSSKRIIRSDELQGIGIAATIDGIAGVECSIECIAKRADEDVIGVSASQHIHSSSERESLAAGIAANGNRSNDRRIHLLLGGGRHGDGCQQFTCNRSGRIAGIAENFVSRIETGSKCGRGSQFVVDGGDVVVQGAPQDADRGTGGGQRANNDLIGPVGQTSRLGIAAKQDIVDHVDLL